jgi:periplasmic nitrate reductase NapE
MGIVPPPAPPPPTTLREERNVFLFLAVFLAPAVSVAGVGALGLSIWIWQMIFGPPG